MQVQQINGINFQRAYHTNLVKKPNGVKKVIDTVTLNNNNEVSITKRYYNDTLVSKLTTLKNKFGEFVKTKIDYYNTKGKKSYTKTMKGLGGFLDEK